MAFLDILRAKEPKTAAELRAALSEAEAASDIAAQKVAEATQGRATALVDGDERDVDRAEAGLARAIRDRDRADLACIELARRLEEADVAEHRASLDRVHTDALAAQRQGAKLIATRYAKLAREMVALLDELEVHEAVIEAANERLRASGDPRRVASADSAARPRTERGPALASLFGIVLPDPSDPYRLLYPLTTSGQPPVWHDKARDFVPTASLIMGSPA